MGQRKALATESLRNDLGVTLGSCYEEWQSSPQRPVLGFPRSRLLGTVDEREGIQQWAPNVITVLSVLPSLMGLWLRDSLLASSPSATPPQPASLPPPPSLSKPGKPTITRSPHFLRAPSYFRNHLEGEEAFGAHVTEKTRVGGSYQARSLATMEPEREPGCLNAVTLPALSYASTQTQGLHQNFLEPLCRACVPCLTPSAGACGLPWSLAGRVVA